MGNLVRSEIDYCDIGSLYISISMGPFNLAQVALLPARSLVVRFPSLRTRKWKRSGMFHRSIILQWLNPKYQYRMLCFAEQI
jgi:hypothetical protein